MNIREIKALAQIMMQSDLSALEVVEGESRVRLERNQAEARPAAALPVMGAPVVPQAPAPEPEKEATPVDFNAVNEIKAPMVGVFYAAPAPDAVPYVKVGSKVKKGDVVCIIEAMKLMNEITAEEDGVIAEICATNGQIVEFGSDLFKIKRVS